MDFTINIGQIINILVFIMGGVGFLYRMETGIAVLKNNYTAYGSRLDKIDKDIDGLTKLAIEIARQDERMAAQDARINTLAQRIEHHIKIENTTRRRRKDTAGSE